tara:strand:- start:15036 stop:15272 length:237 start_codon:yes stop_codon:yes gene_type:complete
VSADIHHFFAPCRWMTIEELIQEFPHLRPDMGRHDSVRLIESGEREGEAAVTLRNGMREEYDKRGRIIGLYPKSALHE